MVHQSTGQQPTVLVVEDQPLTRVATVETLEDAGFQVLEASNADEAIRILEARDNVRIVFTDIDMPGSMDGLKLARAVRDRWPPIKIVITSGQLIPNETDLPAGGRFVAKPYDPARIASTLWDMIT
jgi:CheY-like chemotaxis protein